MLERSVFLIVGGPNNMQDRAAAWDTKQASFLWWTDNSLHFLVGTSRIDIQFDRQQMLERATGQVLLEQRLA
jgi:hypothetical protein